MTMQLEVPRRALLQTMFSDWSGDCPIHTHIQDWQDTDDGFRIALLAEAFGNYRRTARISIPPRTILRWAKQLDIDVPSYDPRRHFLSCLLRDWDQTSISLEEHAAAWQDLSDPAKYQLIQSTLGSRFRNKPIPLTSIRSWIRDLNIKVPRSRRTKTPCKRTLQRWRAKSLSE